MRSIYGTKGSASNADFLLAKYFLSLTTSHGGPRKVTTAKKISKVCAKRVTAAARTPSTRRSDQQDSSRMPPEMAFNRAQDQYERSKSESEGIAFTVFGKPQHQGSMRAFTPKGWTRPVLTSTNKNLKPWRQEVAAAAEEAMRKAGITGLLTDGPVKVKAAFFFLRPKSDRSEESYKTTKPDLDKLVRALLDSMTGTIYRDDSQVATLEVQKFLAFGEMTVVSVTPTSSNLARPTAPDRVTQAALDKLEGR